MTRISRRLKRKAAVSVIFSTTNKNIMDLEKCCCQITNRTDVRLTAPMIFASTILSSSPPARIYELSEEGIRAVEYRETEHYQLTKRFLDDPERMLRYLLEEEI